MRTLPHIVRRDGLHTRAFDRRLEPACRGTPNPTRDRWPRTILLTRRAGECSAPHGTSTARAPNSPVRWGGGRDNHGGPGWQGKYEMKKLAAALVTAISTVLAMVAAPVVVATPAHATACGRGTAGISKRAAAPTRWGTRFWWYPRTSASNPVTRLMGSRTTHPAAIPASHP
jgi:hypothetical protein